MAVHLSNWKKTPVIGKITEIEEDTVVVHYWKGSYNKHMQRGTPWLNQLPKSCILLCNVELEEDQRLGKGTKKILETKIYDKLRQ